MAYGVFVSALIAVTSSSLIALVDAATTRYCIVGAGPGGLQAAYYMQKYNMDYTVFEAGANPGTFFTQYPRHRKLISANKVYTGNTDAEFNLRFDWNSLITNHLVGTKDFVDSPSTAEPSLLFKNFSTVYYPPAEALLDYLAYFASHHRLKVRYHSRVMHIQRDGPTGDFVLQVNGSSDEQRCFAVILASGKSVPVTMRDPENEKVVEGYEAISTNPNDFVNQDVLIIGSGNAALETAESLVSHAAYTHVISRRPTRFAHQTHYVGHARSVNLDLLDRYQLKLLDAFVHGIDANNFTYIRNATTGRVMIKCTNCNPGPTSPARFGFDRVIRALGFKWDVTPFDQNSEERCGSQGESSCSAQGSKAKKYLGVKPFEEAAGRFVEVASNFESVNVPRLYVVGTLMHFRDFKRSAGGFIHGFRYLARSLVNHLREKHERVDCPSVRYGPFPNASAMIDVLVSVTFARFRNVSSLYQMQGQLADVFIIEPRTRKQPHYFRYLQDVPLDQLNSRQIHRVAPRVVARAQHFVSLHLGFGKYNQGPGTMTHELSVERPLNTAEKILWDDDSDPDARLGRAFAPTLHVKRPTEQIMNPATGKIFQPTVPEPNPDGDTPEYELRPGYQFVHPKLFLYHNPSHDEQAQGKGAPRVRGSVELYEDVHNQWDIPEVHLRPLQEFFEGSANIVYYGT